MPLSDGIKVGEARGRISSFLSQTGCYEICAKCPVYGEDGCCNGCSSLVRGQGCGQPNLSCLSYTCGVLNMHLLQQPDEEHGNKLLEFTDMLYGLPREGYRGCELRDPDEVLTIGDPLEIRATVSMASESVGISPYAEE